MGDHDVAQELDEQKEQMFMKALLDDLRALDYMLDNDLIESEVRRIGAEQEMFLVDENLRSAPVSVEVLQHAEDPRLTTEIARFNLEANLTPLGLSGNCFSQMERNWMTFWRERGRVQTISEPTFFLRESCRRCESRI